MAVGLLQRLEEPDDNKSSDAGLALQVVDVQKRFGRGNRSVLALDGLSLSVHAGEVVGLLGPNGAGKSTLLRIIAGLIRQDAGEIRIFGAAAGPQNRRRLGMLVEAPALYPFLTAREHLDMLGRAADNRSEVEPILRRVGLFGAADKKVAGFSLGMKQRLGIGCTLIGRPEAIVLDEPTNGLDPDGIQEVRALIGDLSEKDGLAVLLSSHLLAEVERVCDRVVIIHHGRLAAEGAVADLTRAQGRFHLRVDNPQVVAASIHHETELQEDGVFVRLEASEVPDMLQAIIQSGARVHEAKWVRSDLEQVFLSETREARP